MTFAVRRSGEVFQLRSQAFRAHARVGVGIYVIVAVMVVAILPTLKIPQFLAVLVVVPLIWNQWWARGWFVAFDDGGFTEVLRREESVRLPWREVRGFQVSERPVPSNLRFIGRGDPPTCFVVEALALAGGDPQPLWATAGYGPTPAQPTALQDTQAVCDYLEARRAEAGATA